MTSTLWRGGRVYGAPDPRATALLVQAGQLAWLGVDDEAPEADHVVELDGALVTPAFVDAHVHTTDTGTTLAGLDLSAARSAAELLDAVAAFAAALPTDAVVLGHGWDESTWPTPSPPSAAELGRAGGGRRVYLSQASIHSALCSAALLAASPVMQTAAGYDESGWLRRDAHHVARTLALGSRTPAQRGAAQLTALRTAASLGIAALHECGGPMISGEDDFTALLATAGPAHGMPEVYGYWGELLAAEKAKALGAVGAGGDLVADGALGSRTAHLREPYQDAVSDGSCGYGYVTAQQVAEHLVDCARHDLQGGFHAIGDRALDTVLAGFRLAAPVVGLERLRAARHRIEHVEIADKKIISGLVELGIVASVQPAFDRLWGGPDQMYAARLGRERSLSANPLGAMHGVGVALALGSDSPVTPLDPWGSVRAAMWHHNPAYRMSPRAAFAAHTRGGWRAVHRDRDGALRPAAPATFAVWATPAGVGQTGLPVLEPGAALPVCRRTVLRGVTIFDESDALAATTARTGP